MFTLGKYFLFLFCLKWSCDYSSYFILEVIRSLLPILNTTSRQQSVFFLLPNCHQIIPNFGLIHNIKYHISHANYFNLSCHKNVFSSIFNHETLFFYAWKNRKKKFEQFRRTVLTYMYLLCPFKHLSCTCIGVSDSFVLND